MEMERARTRLHRCARFDSKLLRRPRRRRMVTIAVERCLQEWHHRIIYCRSSVAGGTLSRPSPAASSRSVSRGPSTALDGALRSSCANDPANGSSSATPIAQIVAAVSGRHGGVSIGVPGEKLHLPNAGEPHAQRRTESIYPLSAAPMNSSTSLTTACGFSSAIQWAVPDTRRLATSSATSRLDDFTRPLADGCQDEAARVGSTPTGRFVVSG
jgi:hypothetical protein